MKQKNLNIWNIHGEVTYLNIILLNYFHFGDYWRIEIKSPKYTAVHYEQFDIKAEQTSTSSSYLVTLVMAQIERNLEVQVAVSGFTQLNRCLREWDGAFLGE